MSRRYHKKVQQVCPQQAADFHRGVFDSLIEGYRLIQNRLQKAMKDEQIQRIQCVGQVVDPHCVTVVEVVDDPDRPSGLIVDEIRPGYYWKGKVLRFAEVRAVRSGTL